MPYGCPAARKANSKKYYEANKERRKQKAREEYWANPGKAIAAQRRRYDDSKDPEKVAKKEAEKKQREEDERILNEKYVPREKLTPEERLRRKSVKDATYRAKDPEKHRAYNRRYYAGHKQEFKDYAERNKDSINDQRREHAAKNRARIRARSRKYREVKREHIQAKQKEWREAHKDETKAYNARNSPLYYIRNREKVRERAALWKKLNPKRHQEWREGYKKRFPEKFRARSQKYKAKKRNAVIGSTAPIIAWDKEWRAKRRVKCYWCLGSFSPKKCHADHILALASGGAHEIGNLCVSCGSCNSSKQAKPLGEWNAKLTQPVLL